MIGALSLVIVVWLGTSMNCSRMSTLTGRSMIGIEEPQAGVADHAVVRLAEPEHDHLLVLLNDPDRQVDDHQQDDDEERGDRRPTSGNFHDALRSGTSGLTVVVGFDEHASARPSRRP